MRTGNSIFGRPGLWMVAALVAIGSSLAIVAPSDADSDRGRTVRGGGTTIVERGAPGFIPVLTKIAFNARRQGSTATGSFECLALAPTSAASFSPQSGEFEVNAMYVTGQVTGLTIRGKTATLIGTSTITGLGAGSNVPFEFVVEDGGPGARAVLTTSSGELDELVFNEILVEGHFAVADSNN
jgi:hypothetical protein